MKNNGLVGSMVEMASKCCRLGSILLPDHGWLSLYYTVSVSEIYEGKLTSVKR